VAVMMGNLYAALRDANVPEDKAQKAAEEAAAYDNRMVSVEAKVDRLDGKFERLAWMVGVDITLTLMVLAGLFGLLWKVFPSNV
jgi:hypothetical protein